MALHNIVQSENNRLLWPSIIMIDNYFGQTALLLEYIQESRLAEVIIY